MKPNFVQGFYSRLAIIVIVIGSSVPLWAKNECVGYYSGEMSTPLASPRTSLFEKINQTWKKVQMNLFFRNLNVKLSKELIQKLMEGEITFSRDGNLEIAFQGLTPLKIDKKLTQDNLLRIEIPKVRNLYLYTGLSGMSNKGYEVASKLPNIEYQILNKSSLAQWTRAGFAYAENKQLEATLGLIIDQVRDNFLQDPVSLDSIVLSYLTYGQSLSRSRTLILADGSGRTIEPKSWFLEENNFLEKLLTRAQGNGKIKSFRNLDLDRNLSQAEIDGLLRKKILLNPAIMNRSERFTEIGSENEPIFYGRLKAGTIEKIDVIDGFLSVTCSNDRNEISTFTLHPIDQVFILE